MKKLILLFNTVKYLKVKQIYFRLFYFARAKYRKLSGFKYEFLKESNSTPLKLSESIENKYSIENNKEFSFLNLSKKFEDSIDWNFSKYGKLWTYNLTYFEYLKEKDDVRLIYDFVENIETIKDGLEPFPISLRGMNWIKFLTKFDIKDKKIDDSLYAQYYILLDNLEYHLLGNHLLENGFSLLFGAYYFQDEKLYIKAKEILQEELEEQILEDGGHFELSPMYHQLMLFRLLDCINLIENGEWKIENGDFLSFLKDKVTLMLSWIKNITYKNGDIPLLNDSATKIAPNTKELFEYANNLNLNSQFSILNSQLSSSGYKKISKDNYECIIDIGEVGASYIPGHAHADTFNFEVRINDKPFIVDSGLSTYETNDIRYYQRSTKAHNTVEVLGKNSSLVWGGFRVADRANIIKLEEKEDFIKATHDGYKKYDILHTRSWSFKDDKISVNDSLSKEANAILRLHFHPNITEKDIKQRVIIQNLKFKIQNYNYALEFNKTMKALAIKIEFKKDLKVEINI